MQLKDYNFQTPLSERSWNNVLNNIEKDTWDINDLRKECGLDDLYKDPDKNEYYTLLEDNQR